MRRTITTLPSHRVDRISSSTYRLRWPKFDGQLDVVATDSPNGIHHCEFSLRFALDATLGEATLDLPSARGTIFFRIQKPDGGELMLAERRLPLASVANFRDFGGYVTARGSSLRWQRLYRSGHLGDLDEADKKGIADLGIALVCDFRTEREARANPTRFASGHQPPVLSLRVDPGDNFEFIEWLKSKPSHEDLSRTIRQNYREMSRLLVIDNAPAYRAMFDGLLAAEGPVLIHCSAGKDRTGIGAALILASLDVPRRTVFEDYLLTNEYVDTQQSLAWYAGYLGTELDPSMADAMFAVQAGYLQDAFDRIDEAFGGLDRYFADAMQLDSAAIEELRHRYTQDTA